ncbi:hypothetical protein [Pelomicrobium methylotrophicum]|uniref:Uncharacterized protein n=1 Tax=Pelomicrobium methylotrophicum TaxID=2602750 RepID=A0A5C7EXD0_9PROT|nr:hypothetical protein [Pelomicrobium methylotrophicum]TXF11944.1 hypothetical protein FR698_08045 [Pelomicrobium methylotrophicum]
MPMITLQSPGQRVAAFAIDGSTITIEGLVIDCAAHQQDEAVTLEVRRGSDGKPIIGGDGSYIAIVRIPARRYDEQTGGTDPMTGEPTAVRVPQPLDPDAVELILWPAA